MSRRHWGFFDNPFGGMFDFDHDGKTSSMEQWLGYKMFEETMKQDEDSSSCDCPDCDSDFDDVDYSSIGGEVVNVGSDIGTDYSWRNYCESGIEFDIFPENYETEEEYLQALEDEKYARQDAGLGECESDILPEEYEDEKGYTQTFDETHNEKFKGSRSDVNTVKIPVRISIEVSGSDEYENQRNERLRFIREHGKDILAAEYLTDDGEFMLSKAVKENFNLPVTLPDESDKAEFSLADIMEKIARKDIALAIEVWVWCVENFLPYAEYAPHSCRKLTDYVIDELNDFPDEFKKALRKYLNDNPDFRSEIVCGSDELSWGLPSLTVELIKDGFTDAALAMFEDGLTVSSGNWKSVNALMSGVISHAKNYEELETMEFVEQNFLPKMSEYSDGMILDEIEQWQREIDEYKDYAESNCKQYAYERKNAWRKFVPDGSDYGIDPCRYQSEKEYLEALKEAKYSWRDLYRNTDTYGLNPDDFETQEEFQKAQADYLSEDLERKREESRQKCENILRERVAEEKRREAELLNDTNIYTYCGVKLPFSVRPYSFRTEDETIKIGDKVIVSVGDNDKEMEGAVVSVGQYARIAVPFPLERTKFIIKKISG